MKKSVLLIAGGGTLGTYTAKELLARGCSVDIICLEDRASLDPDLNFIRARADMDFLSGLLTQKKYDGIVNFLHFKTLESYLPYHSLLTASTDHLIFLSSYRVYADREHPIRETSPRLVDVTDDNEFLATENYAVPKIRCEDYIRQFPAGNWTIVRPVISFSVTRFDFLMYSGATLIDRARQGIPVPVPESRRNLTAGVDWAGNSGKLIANLLFREKAIGETFTVSSAPGLTWEEFGEIYTELTGVRFQWVDEKTYLESDPSLLPGSGSGARWRYKYDRCFDRAVDNTKILAVTGLGKNDFGTLRYGLETELSRLKGGTDPLD